MTETIKKYVIGLGTDNSGLTKGLATADRDIAAFASKAKGLLAGLGIGAGFSKIISDFTSLGGELKSLSDSTGIAVEDISRVGLALEQFGGSTSQAAATLKGLQDSMLKAADTGQGQLVNAMAKYGVSIHKSNGQIKTAKELYLDIADAMQGLSKDRQRDLGKMFGLDEASIKMLQQGRKGAEELINSRSELAVITEEDARMSELWNRTLIDIKQTFAGITRQIARSCLPVLQKFADFGKKLSDVWGKNKELITHVANVIKENLAPAFAFAAARIGAALAPLLLKLAPLIAIALAIEDIAVFLQGGDSLLGEILGDSGEVISKIINDILGSIGGVLSSILTGDFKGAFAQIKTLWKDTFFPVVKQLGSCIWESFLDTFPNFAGALKKSFSSLIKVWTAIFKGDFSKAGQYLAEYLLNIPNLIREGLIILYSGIGKLGGWISEAISSVFPKLGWIMKKGFENVTGFFKNLLNGNFIEAAGNLANMFTEVIFPLVGKLAGLFWELLKNLPGFLWDIFKGLVSLLWSALKGLGQMLKEVLFIALDGIIGLIADTKIGSFLGLDKIAFSEKKKREKGLIPEENTPAINEEALKVLSAAEEGKHIEGIKAGGSVNHNSQEFNNKVTINQTFNGETNPEAVKAASRDGVNRSVSELPSYAGTLAFGQ